MGNTADGFLMELAQFTGEPYFGGRRIVGSGIESPPTYNRGDRMKLWLGFPKDLDLMDVRRWTKVTIRILLTVIFPFSPFMLQSIPLLLVLPILWVTLTFFVCTSSNLDKWLGIKSEAELEWAGAMAGKISYFQKQGWAAAMFPYNSDLVTTDIYEFVTKETVEMEESYGGTRRYTLWGACVLTVNKIRQEVLIYKSGYGYFIPFTDTDEFTYKGGRVIDINEITEVDFNYAYNFLCAYDGKYNCPIVPVENKLKVPIAGGMKKP